MNMSTQGPIMLVEWFIILLTDSTVQMQMVLHITHWYVKEHTALALQEINMDKPAGQNH